MKAYTDIEQSKKLAEILPLESADMAWCNNSIKGVNYTDEYSANLYTVKEMQECFDKALNGWDKYWELIPCWSLAALLNILPDTITSNDGIAFKLNIKKNIIEYSNPSLYLIYKSVKSDNIVDACVEMIEKLYELKML